MNTKVQVPSTLTEFKFEESLLKDPVFKVALHGYHKLHLGAKSEILNRLLKSKLAEDPNFELWVPIEVVKLDRFNKGLDLSALYLCSDQVLISNKGRVVNTLSWKGIFYGSDVGGYRRVTLNNTSVPVHRALACLFIPIPDKLRHLKYSQLHVNHKDGIKANNDFSNLEWCTPKENVDHAWASGLCTPSPSKGFDNNLSLPVIVTVDIPGRYLEQQFVLCGNTHIEKAGFIATTVHRICSNDLNGTRHKGCLFQRIERDEVVFPLEELPDELVDLIQAFDTTKEKSRVIIATNLETGTTIEIKGKKEMVALGFHHARVYKCVRNQKHTHKGHSFSFKQ